MRWAGREAVYFGQFDRNIQNEDLGLNLSDYGGALYFKRCRTPAQIIFDESCRGKPVFRTFAPGRTLVGKENFSVLISVCTEGRKDFRPPFSWRKYQGKDMKNQLYQGLLAAKAAGEKKLAILFDPDKVRLQRMGQALDLAVDCGVDYFFIGGSLVVNNMLDEVLTEIRERCHIPMILFPGNSFQLSYRADALLFLSLISGRNPELLIGQHVISAPFLKMSPLEIISTGYMLIDGGVQTSVQYMSNTYPIPAHKEDIAVCTALAGEMLGLKLIYMDAGSGAKNPVSESMIEAVSGAVKIPLIVGGGIRSAEKLAANFQAGADLVVIGSAIEQDPFLLREMAAAKLLIM
jgi:putative glycerol-1-phosphate prenyltransferase